MTLTTLTDLPKWMSHLCTHIIDNMSVDKSKTFQDSINIVSSFDKAKNPFLLIVLNHILKSIDRVEQCEWVIKSKRAVLLNIKLIESASIEDYIAADTSRSMAACDYFAYGIEYNSFCAARSARNAYACDHDNEEHDFYVRDTVFYAGRVAGSSAYESDNDGSNGSACDSYDIAYTAAYDYFADELISVIEGSTPSTATY